MSNESNYSKWASCIASEAHHADTYSVGLMSASRFANDRRAVDRLLRTAASELSQLEFGASTLLLRMDTNGDLSAPLRLGSMPAELKSPLGSWYEIVLPVTDKATNERTLEQLENWLPQWKQQHRLVVVDLGPMHLAPSRNVGRLCDVCYLLLGPQTCASHEWIMQQINAHDRNGTVIAGSVITKVAA